MAYGSSCHDKPITELQSAIWRTGSHSVTYHATQVNTTHLNCNQPGRYSIYLPRRDGRLSWPWCSLCAEMVYLPAVTNPPFDSDPTESRISVGLPVPSYQPS